MAHPDPIVSERNTTTTTTTTSGTSLGFILGALVVVVAILSYFIYTDADVGGSDDVNITIEGAGDAVKGAADAVEGAAAASE